MDKAELLETMQKERAILDALVAGLSDEQLCSPVLDGGRSIKDVLAHLASWERRCVQWLDIALKGETPERPEPGISWEQMDELNEQVFLKWQHRPLQDVMAESRQSYEQLLERVQSMSEEDLTDIHRFSWWDGEPITTLIEGNSFGHYREHIEQIEAWLPKA